jgi:hypothetical protein
MSVDPAISAGQVLAKAMQLFSSFLTQEAKLLSEVGSTIGGLSASSDVKDLEAANATLDSLVAAVAKNGKAIKRASTAKATHDAAPHKQVCCDALRLFLNLGVHWCFLRAGELYPRVRPTVCPIASARM